MLTVGTWNVRTMWAPNKLELLKNEMERYRFDILGLAEMQWTASEEMHGCKVIWSVNEQKHEAGVGFLLSKRAREALLGYKPVSDTVIVARFQARSFNMSVVQVYAPTSDGTDEQVEQFYADLKTTLDDIPKKDIVIIAGDWNAKVESDNNGWEKVTGKFGYGDKNDRKKRLLEFALKHDMIICNTKFQQKDCRKWTWRSNDGKTRNMIDMILIRKKWATSVQQCRTVQGADIYLDHSLVMANIKIKLKKKHKAQLRKRKDIASLSDAGISNAYRIALERHFGQA